MFKVLRDVRTNGIEGVRSLFKRSSIGAFDKVSVKHLCAYLQEREFRMSNQRNQRAFRDAMKRVLGRGALHYEVLTG